MRAIRHLVASAVNGLKPERISIVDETGKLLADGAGDDNSLSAAGADERKVAFRKPPAQGSGKHRQLGGRAGALARADHRRFRHEPHHRDLGQIRSRQPRGALEPEPRGGVGLGAGRVGGPVSVGSELPGAGSNGAGGGRDQSHKSEEIVNYEISRTTKTEVIEAGRVNRISAAVLVDGTYSKNDKGEVAYQPLPKEEIDRIAALVRTAIGFNAKRGDQVEVVNLRFAETPPVPISAPAGWMSYLQFSKDDIMGFAEKGVMALLGLIVLLTVVRPLVRRIVTPEGAQARAGTAGAAGVAGALGLSSVGNINVPAVPPYPAAPAAAASPRAAAPIFPSSAATRRSPSPTAPRR